MSTTSGKKFQHFLHLPPEIGKMVVNKMELDEKCQFARCSEVCNKEAKKSKYVIESLKMYVTPSRNQIEISYKKPCDTRQAHIYEFEMDETGTKYIRCLDKHFEELWRKDLKTSTSLYRSCAEQLEFLLTVHQDQIRYLLFSGTANKEALTNFDYGIKSLNNLEELELHYSMDFSFFTSKLRKPLKSLTILTDRITSVSNLKDIYQVQENLHLSQIKLNYEQMLQVTAHRAYFFTGDLTSIDIFNFVKSWQDGTIWKEVKEYTWSRMGATNLNISELWGLLGAPMGQSEIVVYNQEGRKARLMHIDLITALLRFEVETNE